MRKTLLFAALSLALAGCAGTGGTTASAPATSAAPDAEYTALKAEADKEIKLAKQAGFLWGNTEKFVASADQEIQKGNKDAALKNLKKAIKEAQLAQKQAKDQANPITPF